MSAVLRKILSASDEDAVRDNECGRADAFFAMVSDAFQHDYGTRRNFTIE